MQESFACVVWKPFGLLILYSESKPVWYCLSVQIHPELRNTTEYGVILHSCCDCCSEPIDGLSRILFWCGWAAYLQYKWQPSYPQWIRICQLHIASSHSFQTFPDFVQAMGSLYSCQLIISQVCDITVTWSNRAINLFWNGGWKCFLVFILKYQWSSEGTMIGYLTTPGQQSNIPGQCI